MERSIIIFYAEDRFSPKDRTFAKIPKRHICMKIDDHSSLRSNVPSVKNQVFQIDQLRTVIGLSLYVCRSDRMFASI